MKKFNENLFEKLVKATQSQLLAFLPSELKKRGMNDIVATKDYILCHGDTPLLLVAHLDTVHRETVKEIYKVGGAWSSPQGIGGDDRCGIYMILSLLEKLPFKPYVLFATDEEIGCVGTDTSHGYGQGVERLSQCSEEHALGHLREVRTQQEVNTLVGSGQKA